MDNEDRKYSLDELERYSYRTLQQVAKSLCLPSNVKKMYLIQMIHAKKFKSEEELKDIIEKVRLERLQLSQSRKKVPRKRRTYFQEPDISPSSDSLSPPISRTPKRTRHIVIRCSPENIRQAIAKYNARQSNITRNTTAIRKTYPSPKKSDRVLRSFNIKTNEKIVETSQNSLLKHNSSNFEINNSVFSLLKAQNVVKENQESKFPKVITEVIKKYKPVLNRHVGLDPERSQLLPVMRNVGTNPMVPAKRQRVLSGIFPLVPKEPPKVSYEYVQSVGFRRQDGKISKINALVQKRIETPQIEVTVQDIINRSISHTISKPGYVNTDTNLIYSNINLQDAVVMKSERFKDVNERNKRLCNRDIRDEIYSNIDDRNDRYVNLDRNDSYANIDRNERFVMYRNDRCANTDNRNERYVTIDNRNSRYDGNVDSNEYPCSVYYHKKIRGEQVRSQRSYQRENSRDAEERLPKINDVFSRFNAHSDVTQPIYVQVNDEPERLTSQFDPTSGPRLLEQLYNFRGGFIVNRPLEPIASKAKTQCVYSTSVIATAVAQPTALAQDYNNTRSERDNYYSDLAAFPRICELLKLGEEENRRRGFNCDEEFSTSSSLEDSATQDLGASVTIPEMVEDALELISQDGDYMERIGMDVRIQCVLCPYVCPKFTLEYHIRKEHSNEIYHQEHNSWTMSFSLGSLVATDSRTVLSHDDALFVLAVTCRDDWLRVAACSLISDTNLPKSGSITIYNKITGEPFTWEGEIQTLTPDFACDNHADGLRVQVSKLDLLPNSANVTLTNGELVLKSPNKVVVGHPDLNDIHVILFVKIFN